MNPNDNGNWRRPDRTAAPLALLRNTDVMADVLGFLARRELALQLASVSIVFSTLCNCWCQEQETEADQEGSGNGDKAIAIAAFDRRPTSRSSRVRRCWSCSAIHCVHVVRHLWLSKNGVMVINEDATSLHIHLPNTGRFESISNKIIKNQKKFAKIT